MRRAYRLYELRGDNLHSLQHKTGTPIVLGVWLEADVKLARDGSGNRWYQAGFHSVSTIAAARAYMEHFRSARKERLRIVEVTVDDCWAKDHSPAPVILSRFMKVNRIIENGENDADNQAHSQEVRCC